MGLQPFRNYGMKVKVPLMHYQNVKQLLPFPKIYCQINNWVVADQVVVVVCWFLFFFGCGLLVVGVCWLFVVC